jgi:CheY-like chemotaxis protein
MKTKEELIMSKKILAIDDELDTLTYYSEVLEDANYLPITAANGREGLDKAREHRPDLIILDIMMPEKGGMKTYKELKKDPDLKDIPVIVITGISKLVDFKTLMNRSSTGNIPPAGHLVKPHSADDLIKAVRDVLG